MAVWYWFRSSAHATCPRSFPSSIQSACFVHIGLMLLSDNLCGPALEAAVDIEDLSCSTAASTEIDTNIDKKIIIHIMLRQLLSLLELCSYIENAVVQKFDERGQ